MIDFEPPTMRQTAAAYKKTDVQLPFKGRAFAEVELFSLTTGGRIVAHCGARDR